MSKKKLPIEQAYQLYRENYRSAVKDEILRRARERGVEATEGMADNEVTAKSHLSRRLCRSPNQFATLPTGFSKTKIIAFCNNNMINDRHLK